MDWLEAIVLGIVQGLTEFLPISSSAHLMIFGQVFFNGHDPGAAFTAVTQLGTETAVLIYFWRDIVRIIKQWSGSLVGRVPRSDPDARMGWFVILGSIPIGLLGLVFQDAIDSTLRNLWITVATLGGVGLVLWLADRMARRRQRPKELTELTLRDAIIYGLAQACALIPGVSRSGGTISAGLFLGYSRPAATRYAFLLAIPAVYASGLYKLKDIGADACVAWGPTIVATLIAGGVGYAVIAWLLRYITTHDFTPFVIYRVFLAAGLAALLLTGVLSPDAALTTGCGS
ncbi:MAG: undecaprenyl-diphosphate phosphatase [Brooklawnia sp.]|jgi:undecaprenyl-diphosphatase